MMRLRNVGPCIETDGEFLVESGVIRPIIMDVLVIQFMC
jgi:hypothetical protein